MTNIIEKIDTYLTETTKPTFEEFYSKNMNIVRRYWYIRKEFYQDKYRDKDEDVELTKMDMERAEEEASEDTIKKFKSKFAFNRKDVDDYMEFLYMKFGD